MAYVVVDKEQLESDLGIVCDAIREKGGTSEPLAFPNGMADAVRVIQSGEESEFGESYWVENLSGRTAYGNLFYQWKSETIPFIDTSNGTSFGGFLERSKIKEVPPLDFSKGSNFMSTFNYATNLSKVPLMNLSSATRVDNMFNSCLSLECIEVENTSKIGNWNGFAANCTKLKVVKTLDLSGRTSTGDLFQNTTKTETLLFVPNTIKLSITFKGMSLLTDESVQSIIAGLADLTGATAQTVTFNATVKAKLTDEQKTQITSKNWILA